MREKFKYAGQTVKTKQGVGISSFGQDMSAAKYGDNNNVPLFGDDVVYGKIGPFGHIFHVNELEIEL